MAKQKNQKIQYKQNKQKDQKVNSKVKASGISGAVAVVVLFVLNQFGVEVSSEVAASLTALIAFAAGYLKLEA